MTFDVQAYLERIGVAELSGVQGQPMPSLAALQMLQSAQMRAIAFENIDVFLGRVPDLDEAVVWNRMVDGRRGGYCLELNRLFGGALQAFGFDAAPVLGRVRMGAPVGGPRAHHAFVVSIEGVEWLADTGFGGPGPVGPVNLSDEEPQLIAGETFRTMRDHATGELVLQRLNGEDWFALYGFDRVPVTEADFIAANVVCSRWEQSPFPRHLMMTVANAAGRASMFNRSVKLVRAGEVRGWEITSLTELQSVLGDLFGLQVEAPIAAAVWRKLQAKPAPGAA
ncbi:arylamine N-acetyltransferase [Rhizobium daejeonense]|uniref:Arylamine N-acetyltransferase n=1 Tax=Rhizobium daejeonense TaxID=240521 RepID=A0A6M1RW08_9HYPH|nr:arylamine N-acetyltransferase [Rhizobium daejeonense]NGO63319.1 arylamine N-acetyltransferase [Rhizobium daejeonense]